MAVRARLLLILAFVAFISLGLPDGLIGVAWPSMRQSFGLPLDALGCRTLDPVLGGDALCAAGIATLPADGPAFHVWRLDG